MKINLSEAWTIIQGQPHLKNNLNEFYWSLFLGFGFTEFVELFNDTTHRIERSSISLDKKIGAGHFATVFTGKCTTKAGNKDVAIKVLTGNCYFISYNLQTMRNTRHLVVYQSINFDLNVSAKFLRLVLIMQISRGCNSMWNVLRKSSIIWEIRQRCEMWLLTEICDHTRDT